MRATFFVLTCLMMVNCSHRPYRCESDSNCILNQQQGSCIKAIDGSYCAFTDMTCAEKMRWDESAGPTVANTCVIEGSRVRSWRTVKTAFDVRGIWGTSPQDFYVIGGGAIHHTTDGGKLWKTTTTKNGSFSSISGTAADDVYAVNSTGSIFHSSDRGSTWVETSGFPWGLRKVWGAGDTAFAVGEGGLVLVTEDRGQTWTQRNIGITRALNSVWGNDANDIYIVGEQGTVLHSIDKGVTWAQQTLGTDDLYSVRGRSRTDVFVAGVRSLVRTTDGGMQWKSLSPGEEHFFFDVWLPPANPAEIFAAGDWHVVLHSRDDGSTWSAEPTGTGDQVFGLWGSEGELFGQASRGTLLRYE